VEEVLKRIGYENSVKVNRDKRWEIAAAAKTLGDHKTPAVEDYHVDYILRCELVIIYV